MTQPERVPNTLAIRTWANALLSGKYKQGTRHLNNDGKYCCLGVACEVAIEAGVKVARSRSQFYSERIVYNGCAGSPPRVVREWLGIEDQDFKLLYKKHFWQKAKLIPAIELNDDMKVSFRKIAKAIKRTYPGSM